MLPADQFVLVVDLGGGSGTTALSVFAERRKHIQVVSVESNQAILNYCSQAVENIGCRLLHTALLGSSEKPNPAWDILGRKIDLLLLDTSHEYGPTKKELSLWVPKVRRGGYVWIHDYEGGYPGVKQAVDEMPLHIWKRYKQKGLGWSGEKL